MFWQEEIRKKWEEFRKSRFFTSSIFAPDVFPVVPDETPLFREENPNFERSRFGYTVRPQSYGLKVYYNSRPKAYAGWIRNDVWRQFVQDGKPPSAATITKMLAICKSQKGKR